MKSILIFIILCSVVFHSCKDPKNQEGNNQVNENRDTVLTDNTFQDSRDTSVNSYYKKSHVSIRGYVKNGANADVIIDELDIGQINPLESVVVDQNGGFKFDIDIPEPGIYQLRFTDKNIHLFLRGGNIQITTDISDIGSYSVTGSPESVHLQEMYLILREINNQTYAVQDRVEKLQKDKSKVKQLLALVDSLPIYYAAINKKKSERLIKFIERIDTSMVGLLAAFYLDVDENYDFIIDTRNRFEKICAYSKFYIQLNDKISSIVPVGPGKMAPNTVVDDANGKSVYLSDYLGKTVLIYFWTSYSEPCRTENLEIKKIYDNFHSRGFEVYAISLDEKKDPWLRAIKEDQISDWIHVSNLLGWDDDISHLYNIGEMPYLILVDNKGKIVARGFRSRELTANLLEFM
ncbi:MAG: AhpC/TSA family protein [Bacteroidetes bacterium]|nr:AhpC/TSA family protein [Bacteroidota bacterium]MBL6962257.1 AhpC/TSA family protein [Bacteroidota bacterium]